MLGILFALALQDAVDGDWHGTLDAGALKLRLAVHVVKKADGSLGGTFDSLDQGANGLALDKVAFAGGRFSFELPAVRGAYVGTISADGSKIEGLWTQGAPLKLVLIRGAATPLKRPQVPMKPYPYDEVDVDYENPAAKIRLAGTLTIPRGAGPHPAVVLVTGSGAQDRDESLLGHRPFLVLADHLTRAGVAVLRSDDRGVGKSGGSMATATSEDFAGDALAAIAFLKGRPGIDAARLGIAGHSEGGLIAPMCAARSKDVAFIALLAGPGTTGERILLAQAELIGREAGMEDDAIRRNAEVSKRIYDAINEAKDGAEADARVREIVDGLDAPSAQGLRPQIPMLVSPWFRFFLKYDPTDALRRVTCPVLAVNGEKDLQVPCAENLEAIAKALKAGGNGRVKSIAFPGLNHLFQTCTTGAPSEYGTIEETFAPAALEAISGWIVETTRKQ